MQKNTPVALHRVPKLFAKFCSDMEILPSYTPIFIIDGRGRIVEKKNVAQSGAFPNIVCMVSNNDMGLVLSGRKTDDAYAVEASFGEGKDFIVVSKDEDEFSRCVVCSASENGCVKLRDYLEKLSCYRDYLDSFASLVFSSSARTPVMRMFRTRISGATELLRLSEDGEKGRNVSIPLRLALEKLAGFALSERFGRKAQIVLDGVSPDISVSVPDSFFKLVISVVAMQLRHSKSGKISISAQTSLQNGTAVITMFGDGFSGAEELYNNAIVKAFERAGLMCRMENETFEFVLELSHEKTEILMDSEPIIARIDMAFADELISDMYFTIADI